MGMLDTDINKILNTYNPKADGFVYNAYIHTVKDDIPIRLFKSIEVTRNYNKAIADNIIVALSVSGTDFLYKIAPNKNDLEISILYRYRKADGSTKETTTRYKFVLINNNANLETSKYNNMSPEDIDSSEIFEVIGQCVLREVMGMRALQTSGVYQDTTVKDVIIGDIVSTAKTVKIENKPMEFNVDMVEPNNKNIYKNIVIPTGINLLSLPSYLQNNEYGVYNGHIGTYMQYYKEKPTMFIFPLYNYTRYETAKHKLLIFYNPNGNFNMVENSYAIEGETIKILANTNTKSMDKGEQEIISDGESMVTLDSNLVLDRPVIVSTDEISIDSTTILSGAKIKDKDDGIYRARYIQSSNNLYIYRSDILKKSFGMWQVEWMFADTTLLIPGMPTCLVYEDPKAGIVKLYGTLQAVYDKYDTSLKYHHALLFISIQKPTFYNSKKKE